MYRIAVTKLEWGPFLVELLSDGQILDVHEIDAARAGQFDQIIDAKHHLCDDYGLIATPTKASELEIHAWKCVKNV